MSTLKGFRILEDDAFPSIVSQGALISSCLNSHGIFWSFSPDNCDVIDDENGIRVQEYNFKIQYHTGEFDRNQTPIYEGDWVRSMSCEEPWQVPDLVTFLKRCGAYEAEHGVRMCDSLIVVEK